MIERKSDVAIMSIFLTLLTVGIVWCFGRWQDTRMLEIHTKAGHSLVMVPKGYTTVWVVKDRGIQELMDELQDKDQAHDAKQ